MVDFPTWFHVGWYGGLTCCLFAIATNILYSALHRRGRMRQLRRVTMLCVISALGLLPAIIWFNGRFTIQQTRLSVVEVIGMLVYITLCGWVVPLGITSLYCLFALPRIPPTALKLASAQPFTTQYRPPRYQPGVKVPFVFSQETPWGWLEYRSGNFQGQRLALKLAIVTIGRDEQCDIWLDDDMASRFHAELAWDNGHTYLTDCESLNGVLLNQQRVHGTSLLTSNDLLQIGTHRFIFVEAEQKDLLCAQDDPLSRHTWRSTQDLQTGVRTSVSLIANSVERIPQRSHPAPQREMTSETDNAISSLVSEAVHTLPPPLPRTVRDFMSLKLPSKQRD